MIASPLAEHMLAHILAMNVVAPVLSIALDRIRPGAFGTMKRWLGAFALLQLVLFVGWHLPVVFAHAHDSTVLQAAMHLSLFAAAVLFWRAVLGAAAEYRLGPIFPLLITGKILCLFAILLLLSPRPLYHAMAHHVGVDALADQQLAGLVMLIACPLAYVAASVVLAVRWVNEMARRPLWQPDRFSV